MVTNWPYMREKAFHVLTACLTFVAALNAIAFVAMMALWVTIGDTHDEIWSATKYLVIALAVAVPLTWLALDWKGKTSTRSRKIRFWISTLVTLFALTQAVMSEAGRIKGWSSEQAALNVASSLYPGSAGAFTLQQLSREELSAVGRGPSITYLVMDAGRPACKVGVCRRYWLWWTCGMYETLKDRNTTQNNVPSTSPDR